jgi:Methyltransferase domain
MLTRRIPRVEAVVPCRNTNRYVPFLPLATIVELGLTVTSSNTLPLEMSIKRASGYSVHGVRLKHFEEVLIRVLPYVQPHYVQLPPLPTSNDDPASSSISSSPSSSSTSSTSSTSTSVWPFDQLPNAARVQGDNPGQLSQPQRARRKEQQLQSMLRCILPLIPPPIIPDTTTTTTTDRKFVLVDFGGGSGHLAIPLALLLPHCIVVVVDLNQKSLSLMHHKVDLVVEQVLTKTSNARHSSSSITTTESVPCYANGPNFRRCGRNGVLENLLSFQGPVEEYTETFDMALALHLCGQATDVAIRKAISVGATSLVMAPCCVGKLSRQALNPDIYHATGQNTPTVVYPQSSTVCPLIPDPADWDALAKAADYSNEQESRTARNATRRTAKAVLETDRRLFLESYAYRTALVRMDPWEATPKNDIVVAWDPTKFSPDDSLFRATDHDAEADMQVVRAQLLEAPGHSTTTGSTAADGTHCAVVENSDWTKDEEEEIHTQISDFLHHTERMPDKMDQVLLFPTRMGGRKRKLIHFVANTFDLAHWSVGDKDSEKTVAVARRGRNRG